MSKQLISALVFSLSVTLSIGAQSVYPGQFEGKFAVTDVATPAVKSFDLKDVRLLPSRFRQNMERDSAWMVSIDVNRLVHSFRNSSGIFASREGGYMTVSKLGGWESLDCDLRGHTTGHLLSALALMYASTQSPLLKAKGDSIVSALAEVQAAYGNGYLSAYPEELINRNIKGNSVWAPWYTLHKILSGLIDQYIYTDNHQALEVAKRMGDWAWNKISPLSEETRRKMIRNEFGGINEALYNLFSMTGDSNHLKAAEFFYHNDVIDPLKEKKSDLGTAHTNTFIPKVIAEMRRYELLGDETSLDLSRFFWDTMIDNHVFAPGCLSDKEHYFNPTDMAKHISGYTGETCCTYNMLKLSRHLFCNSPSGKIADYYERALYNHILGQQNPETGMVHYFLPLQTGCFKVYSTPENSFWCCVGSGFENHAKYTESIYFHDDNSLYVNLFIPSTVNWSDKGITLRQNSSFPESEIVEFTVSADSSIRTSIKLRRPSWADKPIVKVNGKKVKISSGDYIILDRIWKSGDKVELTLPMSLHVERVKGNDSLGAIFYGPVLLAGELGTDGIESPAPTSNPSLYNDYYTYDYKIPDGLKSSLRISGEMPQLVRQGSSLKFVSKEGDSLLPFYDMHDQRYVVYWNLNE